LGEILAEGPALVMSLAWREGPAQEEEERPLEPAGDVDQECSGDILVLFEVDLEMGW
jgi:hypothetical protein